MSQSQHMVDALKRLLKERGVSYAQAAGHLGLSHSSVKRLFSTGAFTLERLEALCHLAEVDVLELARLADARRHRMDRLSAAQERELVADPLLLLAAICVLNRWPFERIVAHYRVSEPQLIALLMRLHRMGLIELLPGNRVKLHVARNFAWLPDGPIQRYFVAHVQNELLSGPFAPGRDMRRFAWGLLTAESAALLRGKMEELLEMFDDLTGGDEVRAASEGRATGTCLLVALREWEPAHFQAMRRDDNPQGVREQGGAGSERKAASANKVLRHT